jgi:hypothetical protein
MAQRSTPTQVGYTARRDSPFAVQSDGEDVSVRLRRLAERRPSTNVLRGEQRVIARPDPTSLVRPCAIAPLLAGCIAAFEGGGHLAAAGSSSKKV